MKYPTQHAIQEVLDFQSAFTDAIVDQINECYCIVRDIYEPETDSELAAEQERLRSLYIHVAHQAAIQHQATGQRLDACLYDCLEESDESTEELILSQAIYYAEKAEHHYARADMTLAMQSMLNARHYIGAYFGGYHVLSLERDKRIEQAKQAVQHNRNVKAQRGEREQWQAYYTANKHKWASKNEAAAEIAKLAGYAEVTVRQKWLTNL